MNLNSFSLGTGYTTTDKETNDLSRFMSHVDAIFNETNDLIRSMSHVDTIFNVNSNTYGLDEISVPRTKERDLSMMTGLSDHFLK